MHYTNEMFEEKRYIQLSSGLIPANCMRRLVYVVVVQIAFGALALRAQRSQILGDWREPAGSVIRIEQCSSGICLELLSLGPGAPTTWDIHNPDPAQRDRTLCNLQIGSHFHLNDPVHADGGIVYDPKSGKTYRGSMALEDHTLKLRGYVGISIFGRTQVWHRVLGGVAPCHAPGAQ